VESTASAAVDHILPLHADRLDSNVVEHHPGFAAATVKVRVVVLAVVADHAAQQVARARDVRPKDAAEVDLRADRTQQVDDLLLRRVGRRPHKAHRKHLRVLMQLLGDEHLLAAVGLVHAALVILVPDRANDLLKRGCRMRATEIAIPPSQRRLPSNDNDDDQRRR